MKNIKLGGSFFCPRCQCIHSSAFTCKEIQEMKKRQQEFFDNFRETTEEEKAMQTQSLFTLTAEEVELVKIICQCQYDMILEEYCSQKDIDCSEDKKAFDLCENLLSRIKVFQNGQNNKN